MGDRGRDEVWEGMTVGKLCEIVAGMGFRQYLDCMGKDGYWIDTAFLHGLGSSLLP